LKKICLCLIVICFTMFPAKICHAMDGKAITMEDTTGHTTEDIADGPEISAPSAILMEMSTGKVICGKGADTRRAPASVTKIMTMLLIFDAIESGKISLDEEVTTSEYAASMGGSQVFLEPGEKQTVDTMLKCIAVASANDACVAMAEHIYGSEESFVEAMNLRAQGLGMHNTNFVNCNGLDAEGHVTTAKDIAIMSRELVGKYPQIENYARIWMENITHTTQKGTKEFGLTNTNKLIRQYEYATGLKTGSTDEAGFCVSATAKKNEIHLIAVIMGADTSKQRFQDAVSLLNYGFSKCQIYTDHTPPVLKDIIVKGGTKELLELKYKNEFTYLDVDGLSFDEIVKEQHLPSEVEAPVKKGAVMGTLVYSSHGREIGSVDIIAKESVKKAKYFDYLKSLLFEMII